MSIFAIADLHLSLDGNKSMEIFSGWDDYVQKLEENWKKIVTPEDTVVIPGDISWAMKLEDTLVDFQFLDSLPGQKVLLKGNHDYWWTTAKKMSAFVAEHRLYTLNFLHNDCYPAEGVAICGTRSWLFEQGEEFDQKLVNREAGRLDMSLTAAKEMEKIVFLHYPPIYRDGRSDKMIEIMHKHGVNQCYYGHLHAHTIKNAFNDTENGIRYKLVSADALKFIPYKVL